MRLLQIASVVPFPADDGGKVVLLHTTRQFVRLGVSVQFVAPRVRANDFAGFEAMGVKVHLLDFDPENSILGGLRNLFEGIPYNISKYHSVRALEQLRALVTGFQFDSIQVESLHLAYYGLAISREFGVPSVLREHNFQAEVLRRVREHARNPLVRRYFASQYERMLQYEAKIAQLFDVVVPISCVDEKKLKGIAPAARTEVIPAGVDVEQLLPRQRAHGSQIVFLTNYGYYPNRDGFRYYVRQILPRLSRMAPAMTTIVLGKDTDQIPMNERKPGISVRGFVDNLNEVSLFGSVAVVPLRIGGGMRVKILELMALGMAIVSTSVGAEGIQAVDGEHILIADTPEEFAAAIIRLVGSPMECERLGSNARRLIEREYAWDAIGDRFVDLHNRVIERHVGCRRGGS
jgi:polysaccharide biosynthesis protein PslH